MKVSFEYTKKEYIKYLLKSRKIKNIFIYLLILIIYIIKNINKFYINKFIIFLVIWLVVVMVLNIIYVLLNLKYNEMINYNTYGKYILGLSNNKFSLTLNKSKVDYKYNTIKKIVCRKKYFIIKFKNSREYLTFEESKFNNNDYNKILDYFKSKC